MMIRLNELVTTLQSKDLGPFMGVPCSVFKDLLNFIIEKKVFEHYACSSEGESLGLAAGFSLAGKYPVVYMQNDGLGNAINPLSSLQLMYDLPALLLVSWRGEPGKVDALQHKLMGTTLKQLFDLYEIPYSVVTEETYIDDVNIAVSYMKKNQRPYALIFKKGLIEKFKKEQINNDLLNLRYEYIEVLAEKVKENDILLGTTGFTGRELYQKVQLKSKFYMMGSMGCLPSIGLGLAKSYPDKRVFVLDGDGALLMKLGSLATLGNYKADNIIHICLDNQQYESTGGQITSSGTVNFANLALSCDYKEAITIKSIAQFVSVIDRIDTIQKPLFLHVKIKAGSIKDLKRPSLTPIEMKKIFMENL